MRAIRSLQESIKFLVMVEDIVCRGVDYDDQEWEASKISEIVRVIWEAPGLLEVCFSPVEDDENSARVYVTGRPDLYVDVEMEGSKMAIEVGLSVLRLVK